MRWISNASFLIGGMIAGASACWLMVNGLGDLGLQRLSSQQLGRVLLARVSDTLIYDSRQQGRPADTGVLFYDTPVAITDFLCRITEFNIYSEVVTGEERRNPGTMDAREVYAIWREPSEAQGRLGSHRPEPDQCSDYRDFEHLIRGYSNFDVEGPAGHRAGKASC